MERMSHSGPSRTQTSLHFVIHCPTWAGREPAFSFFKDKLTREVACSRSDSSEEVGSVCLRTPIASGHTPVMKTFLFPRGISGNIFLVTASCCNFVFIWMLRPEF